MSETGRPPEHHQPAGAAPRPPASADDVLATRRASDASARREALAVHDALRRVLRGLDEAGAALQAYADDIAPSTRGD